MNLQNILFHLKEAEEELNEAIEKIEKNKDYDSVEFNIAMSHLYNHLNTAWNSRTTSKEEAISCSEEDFQKWRKFPKNEEFSL